MFDLIILMNKIIKIKETKTWHWLSGGPWFIFQKKRQKAKPELNCDFFADTFTQADL